MKLRRGTRRGSCATRCVDQGNRTTAGCGAIERQSLGGRHRAHVAPTRRARAPVWSGRLGRSSGQCRTRTQRRRAMAGRRAPPGPHGGRVIHRRLHALLGRRVEEAVRLSSSRTLTSLLSASLSIFYDCTSRREPRRCGSIATCSPTTPQPARIERHWLDALQLPEASLLASTVNRYSKYSQKKRTNSLPYGTATLRAHSTRILQTLYGSIQELGTSTARWLG